MDESSLCSNWFSVDSGSDWATDLSEILVSIPTVNVCITVRDRSIFIGGLGPVQNVVGHKLFYDEKSIGPNLFSIPSLIGKQLF